MPTHVDFTMMTFRQILRRGAFGLAAAATVTVTVCAHATATRTFVLDTLDKLSGGELEGVAVSSDGSVRAGLRLGSIPISEPTAAFAVTRLADGTSLVGTSPQGKIYRIAGDTVTQYADTGALAVTSIVQTANGNVYAATIPDGKVFRVFPGRAEVFSTLAASHVWALVADKKSAGLFAAAGPDARIFRIEPSGANSVYFRSSESHFVSLAVGEAGELYAGSSGKGEIFKITGPGRASVLFDLPGDEVKAIACSRGSVWAISNEYGEPPDLPKRPASTAHTPSGPGQAPRPKAGKGQLTRFDRQGRPERMMKHDDTHYMSLTLDDEGVPYVGTGLEGRVYSVNDAHVVTLMADTDQRQVGAISLSRGGGWVVSSDPVVAHRVLGQGGRQSVWTSKALDASLLSTFGTLSWRASGPLEFSTRTGNTAAPDETWSAWSRATPTQAVIGSPHGRFVQVRASWARDPSAVLYSVEIPFLTENVRPVVTEVSALTKTAQTKEPVATLPAATSDVPKHESVVKVTWKVENPDNDALRYRIVFRREGQGPWRDALKADEIHTKTELDWETANLPEGKYRLRVEASDEQVNPPDQVRRHALESETVLVDNTPPRIETLELAGRRLRAHVVDGVSAVTRVDVAFDGKVEWHPLGASDGLFDTPDERIDTDLGTLLPSGSHIVIVRAIDAAGNATTRDIESR